MNKTNLDVTLWNEPVLENFSKDNSVNIAKVEYNATGHLNGSIKSVYLIHYTKYDTGSLHEAQSTFTGYSIFTGTIDNKPVQIVFEENGKHDNGLNSTLAVKNSAGELGSINGPAKYSLQNGKVILETEF